MRGYNSVIKIKQIKEEQIMENKAFTYQYSAAQSSEVENIRSKYLIKEESKLEKLRRLDRKVQTAGMAQSLALGIIGSLIFGVGMCFGLDALAGPDWLTVAFGGAGVVLMLPAYPLYRRIHKRTKEKLAPEILQLTEEMM